PLGENGTRPRFYAHCPRSAAGARGFAEQLKCLCGPLDSTSASGSLDQLHHRPGREPELACVLGGLFSRGERLVVTSQPVVEHRACPLRERETHSLATS